MASTARRRPRFFIARYPVTVAQWRAYYDAADAETKRALDSRSLEGIANHPVVWVSWSDVHKYCRWLTAQLDALAREKAARSPVPEAIVSWVREGWGISVPTEGEWDKAARGTETRPYPWGSALGSNRTKNADAGIFASSAVGCFPSGATAREEGGVEDLCGNVWEWIREPYGGEQWRLPLLVKGGGWSSITMPVRRLRRQHFESGYRDSSTGFRLVLSPFRF